MVPAVSLLLDLVLLGLLVFSFVMGVRRGFLLSLCSLLAVLVALLGGWYLAAHWSQPLEERLEPVILETLTQREAEEKTTSPLPDNLPQALQDQAAQTAQDWKNATLAQAAAFLAGAAAKVILFLAGFFVVLLLWNLLFHALNLVAKLPGLHGLNKFFGGALGLVKGLLLLMLARWVLCDLLGWIPADVTRDSILLSLLPSLDLFALLEGTLPSIHT
ncbi:CvpA family protein [Evtepia sp.]